MREWINTDNEWFLEIPVGWGLEPLKKFASTNTGITFTKADLVEDGNAVLSYGQVHAKNNPQTFVNPDLIKYIPDTFIESKESAKVNLHDFIFADTSEDLAGCGNCIFIAEPIDLYAGYHTILLRNSGLECGKYFAYQFISDEWRSQIRKRVKSVKLFSVTQGILNQTFILIPPKEEQEAIAAYLDKVCEKIGREIELLERKADAYSRLRRSLINRAVTRGLNPNALLKPSGIDWVGEIPEHWNVSRFAHYFREHTISNKGVNHQNLLSLSFGKIIRKDIDTCDGLLPASFETYQIVEPGNIILRFTDLQNDHRSLRVGLVKEEGIITSAYTCVEGNDETIPEFCYYLLHSYDIKKVFYKLGGGMRQTLNYKTTKDMGVVIPPVEEQKEIAAYLDEKCGKIDAIIEKIGTKVERLKELKRSLINEVVTGKRAINNI